MQRKMVAALLAAAGTAMSAAVSLTHGDLVPIVIAGASASTALAVYLPLAAAGVASTIKKIRAT
jgi:hypothetical protein